MDEDETAAEKQMNVDIVMCSKITEIKGKQKVMKVKKPVVV